VASLGRRFQAAIEEATGIVLASKGMFYRDRDMLFWWRFADNFGANPSTPYMFNALPLLGFLLPSPIWSLGKRDAIVLIARVPPPCEYFSLTLYAMFRPQYPALPFASLGDSINHLNIKQHDGLFAHVVAANQRTYDLVKQALIASGIPASAINLAAVPSTLGLMDAMAHAGGQLRLGTYFELLMRLFRFHNQTEGDAYLKSFPPVFYVEGTHSEEQLLVESSTPGYLPRSHPQSVDESPLAAAFDAYGAETCAHMGAALGEAHTSTAEGHDVEGNGLTTLASLAFAPLKIMGLECLVQRTKCLGDGPDAAYFAPNVHEDRDEMELLRLGEDELHAVTMVDHRKVNASVYGSVALVRPSSAAAPTLSKSFMQVRATPLGVTSFDLANAAPSPFASWVFTRNPSHCERLLAASGVAARSVGGCTVVTEEHVPRGGHLTYCERVYLDPASGRGPEWSNLLPARVYHLRAGATITTR